ncbi:uncharacterized protein [Hetaerina americana]|uniref:uncharacterized protein n=1 Tax=Hetaerina americana TaxID=62018 RepID=UPI003A7F168F
MPNVGGPKQKRRALLTSVTTSVITYGIAIWANALATQSTRSKETSVYRLSALRVASGFRTMSKEAIEVISGLLPIEILAEDQKEIFKRRKALRDLKHKKKEEQLKTEERKRSLGRWQKSLDDSTKGRWTQRLIPQVDEWLNRSHGEVNYYLTHAIRPWVLPSLPIQIQARRVPGVPILCRSRRKCGECVFLVP